MDMLRHDDVDTGAIEAKRLAECSHKAEYRARQRHERAILHAEVQLLQTHLQIHLRHKASQQRHVAAVQRPLHHGAFSANQIQNSTLRAKWTKMAVLGTVARVQSTYFADFMYAVLSSGGFLYQRHYKPRYSLSRFELLRRYDLSGHVVIVQLYLREDECLPLEANQWRHHGFGRTTFDRIADDVTLYRSRFFQSPAVSTVGIATFDHIARVMGVTRDVILARMENNIQRFL
ncbi:Aste57867_12571 [Aphanomyces stellatus]|uniref:Aste57867_12571 protein n=1 Tax=Aphanomyces stellatus TaxID=120398 RepID=A0A485KVZ6_9STRA|nr:hypothetical protein As57867_012525 [Aphanomyces stellatus]VFT89422.1 Aste57867_12571 [Aphanomyces stellatus]